MAAGNRANENDANATGYELGDLEIVRTGRASGERPVVQVPGEATGVQKTSAGRGAPRNLTLADGEMSPALELDIGPPAAAARGSLPQARGSLPATSGRPGAPPPPPAAAQATAVLASFGDKGALDDDFDQGGFAKLPALEVEKVERRSAERVVAKEAAPDAGLVKQQEEYAAVVALAAFGPTPGGWLSSVGYAVHVGRRVWKLRGERAQALEAQRQRLTELHAAMVAMGQALLRKASDPRTEPLKAKVARVHEEHSKLERANQGVSRTREGNERAMALLRSEAEHLKEQLAPYVDAEKQAAEAHRKADEELRRGQAMQKRVEIELRALESATTEVDPARSSALQAQLEQRKAVVTALSGTLAQATEALGKARRDLAHSRGALDANEEKQKRLEAESKAREAEAEGQKREANGAFEAALSELAEAARKLQLGGLTPEAAEAVRKAEAAVEQATLVLSRYDRALSLYDRTAVIRGACVAGGTLAALIAALIFT